MNSFALFCVARCFDFGIFTRGGVLFLSEKGSYIKNPQENDKFDMIKPLGQAKKTTLVCVM